MKSSVGLQIPDQVWQITCRALNTKSSAIELLYANLIGVGIDLEDMTEQVKCGYREIALFLSDFSSAKKMFAKIKSLRLLDVKISLKVLKKADWQDRWKRGVEPFALTRQIEVVPRWAQIKYKQQKRFPVFIDTNLAFGTGLHETTRFMARLIECCRGNFQSFLDVGTGTGILAIIARYYGAEDITAIDMDPQSMAVAKANFAANHVKKIKLLCVDLRDYDRRRMYDFVAANLVTDDLVSFGQKLVSLAGSGKYLAVSGISLKNLPRFEKFFRKLPLKKVKFLGGKKWAAILYQRVRL